MKACVELRIIEELAAQHLPSNKGIRLGDSVRKVFLEVDDPLLAQLVKINAKYRERGTLFVSCCDVVRTYEKPELDRAALLHLKLTSVFDPTGEECDTEYDESVACPLCHSGRKQIGPLRLDLRCIPKTSILARTLAGDEWVVSQKLAEALMHSDLTGFELRPIVHRSNISHASIDFNNSAPGRDLLALAASEGLNHDDWRFYVWLNTSERAIELSDAAWDEAATTAARWRPPPGLKFYQLSVTSRPVELAAQTRAELSYIEHEQEENNRCPLGHNIGLNLISEVFWTKGSWDGADFARSRQTVGHRMGVLAPEPLIFVSQKARALLSSVGRRGYEIEPTYEVYRSLARPQPSLRHEAQRSFEKHLALFKRVVERVEEGYALTIDDFWNDVDSRNILQELMEDNPMAFSEHQLELKELDRRFMAATRPRKDWPEYIYRRIPLRLSGEILEQVLGNDW